MAYVCYATGREVHTALLGPQITQRYDTNEIGPVRVGAPGRGGRVTPRDHHQHLAG
jgi:hypothetical protein